MEFYWLILGTLSVWRVTHLLYGEDGPWNIFTKFRGWVGDGFFGSLLDCFYCLSIWISIPAALWLGEGWGETILLWLAMSGGAILLERSTTNTEKTPPLYFEGKER